MGFELLNKAAHSPAFDPAPPPDSLASAYVPYAVLTGDRLEEDVVRDLNGYGRIALVAPTGAGKSSVARAVLRTNEQSLAPIWINVATEDHALVGTVRGFLEILGGQLLNKAKRANKLSARQRQELLRRLQRREPLGKEEEKLRSQLGASLWMLKSELASDVTSAMDYGDAYRVTEELRDAVREVLAILRDNELIPVLVADDTDRLLQIGSNPALSEKLFRGFFGEVLREITDQLECGLLVAAHDRYAERDDYVEMTDGRLRNIPLPRLSDPANFGQLITARVEFLDEKASWRDLVDEGALRRLCELHLDEHKRSVRRTLTTLKEALVLAAAEAADICTMLHVDASAAGTRTP